MNPNPRTRPMTKAMKPLRMWALVYKSDNTIRGIGHRGSKNGIAKLTESQILDIRKRFEDGSNQKTLAAEFGIHKAGIWRIVRRKAWTHI